MRPCKKGFAPTPSGARIPGGKFEPFHFPLFSPRNIDHVFFCRSSTQILKWFEMRIICASNSISLRISINMLARVNVSFDDFLNYLTMPPYHLY